MRKTKIICTLGPSTDKGDVLEQLMLSGMNVARLNFSHDTYENQKKRIDKVKALRSKHNLPVACLLDTKGPEIRLKTFKDERGTLEMGQDFCLTTRDVEGTKDIVSVTHKDLHKDIHVGSSILIDDGLVGLKVVAIKGRIPTTPISVFIIPNTPTVRIKTSKPPELSFNLFFCSMVTICNL